MASLKERLKALKAPESIVTIGDERFLVVGLLRSVRAAVFASCQGTKGKVDSQKLENILLSMCVKDPDSGELVFQQSESNEWNNLPAAITGPLFAEVMKLNGIDNEDVGREVKKSETTDTQG